MTFVLITAEVFDPDRGGGHFDGILKKERARQRFPASILVLLVLLLLLSDVLIEYVILTNPSLHARTYAHTGISSSTRVGNASGMSKRDIPGSVPTTRVFAIVNLKRGRRRRGGGGGEMEKRMHKSLGINRTNFTRGKTSVLKRSSCCKLGGESNLFFSLPSSALIIFYNSRVSSTRRSAFRNKCVNPASVGGIFSVGTISRRKTYEKPPWLFKKKRRRRRRGKKNKREETTI